MNILGLIICISVVLISLVLSLIWQLIEDLYLFSHYYKYNLWKYLKNNLF